MTFLQKKATQYWGDYYGVLTKTFGFCKGHQLAVTAGWYFHQGNQPAFNKGPFGGIRYTPAFCRELKLLWQNMILMAGILEEQYAFGNICLSMCLPANLLVFLRACVMNVL